MSLLKAHEEFLATSLESTDYFGVPITFESPDGLISFTVNGQSNVIGRDADAFPGEEQMSGRANCSVRLSTLKDQLDFPVAQWKVTMSPQPDTQLADTYVLQNDGFIDKHLGFVTFFLDELEAI